MDDQSDRIVRRNHHCCDLHDIDDLHLNVVDNIHHINDSADNVDVHNNNDHDDDHAEFVTRSRR